MPELNMPATIGSSEKLARLQTLIQNLGQAVVCCSGGLDSSFLLWVCSITLPAEKLMAATFDALTVPSGEKDKAIEVAAYLKVKHIILPTPEMDNPDFLKNDLLRCYYCKRERFAFLQRYMQQGGCQWAILEGSQVDDLEDYRPGMKAAGELKILSPLLQAGMSRADIELISRQNKLPFRDYKTESCLATRIKTGQIIEPALLSRIDQAEAFIKNLGFELVRVRCDHNRASIEVEPDQVPGLMQNSPQLKENLSQLGFTSIAIAPQGYQVKKRVEG